MRYKLEELYVDMKKRLPLEEYNKAVWDIYGSEQDVLIYLRDGTNYLAKNNTDDKKYDTLLKNAILGMKKINNYCEKFGYEPIFLFDEADWKTVLKCASNLNNSIAKFSISH